MISIVHKLGDRQFMARMLGKQTVSDQKLAEIKAPVIDDCPLSVEIADSFG